MQGINPAMPAPLALDEDRIAAQGLALRRGQHLRLISDVRDESAVAELVAAFDAAVPQWCQRFEIAPRRAQPWQLTAMVMASPDSIERFRAAGLIPADLPPFAAGYNRGHELWMFWQPGDYYTRHLLLHEGTHGFMQWFLGGSGPPWYSEGMAEVMALHRWNAGDLEIGIPAAEREQTPYWGRPRVIREEIARGASRSLDEVFTIPGEAFREVDNYGWAWAACRFLNQHPLSRETFGDISGEARFADERFNARLKRRLEGSWAELEREWNLYQHEMEYGYGVEAAQIGEAAQEEGNWLVRADRGWQRTGIRVAAGDTVSFQAAGRFQIREGSPSWDSEANGVTIEYYRGRPLGLLEALVLPDNPEEPVAWKGQPLGAAGTLRAPVAGEIALRLNDHPSQRNDNRGEVRVQRMTPSRFP